MKTRAAQTTVMRKQRYETAAVQEVTQMAAANAFGEFYFGGQLEKKKS